MNAHRSHRLIIVFSLVLAAVPFIAGCSQFEHFFGDIFGGGMSDIEPPPQQLAIEGMEHLKAHRYKMAIESFQKIKDLHPYSKYAILADLKIADAHYLNQDFEKAMVAYQEFEQLHPNNEAVPYVIHQQGMCYLDQVKGFDREQVQTVRAIQTFSRLMQTYPESRYSAMAMARLTEAQTSLAHHEFLCGHVLLQGPTLQGGAGTVRQPDQKLSGYRVPRPGPGIHPALPPASGRHGSRDDPASNRGVRGIAGRPDRPRGSGPRG